MDRPEYLVRLATASDAAHEALEGVDGRGGPPDAQMLVHALDPLLWVVSALLNRVADAQTTQASVAEVFSRASSQIARSVDDLLNEVGHPGQVHQPPANWPMLNED